MEQGVEYYKEYFDDTYYDDEEIDEFIQGEEDEVYPISFSPPVPAQPPNILSKLNSIIPSVNAHVEFLDFKHWVSLVGKTSALRNRGEAPALRKSCSELYDIRLLMQRESLKAPFLIEDGIFEDPLTSVYVNKVTSIGSLADWRYFFARSFFERHIRPPEEFSINHLYEIKRADLVKVKTQENLKTPAVVKRPGHHGKRNRPSHKRTGSKKESHASVLEIEGGCSLNEIKKEVHRHSILGKNNEAFISFAAVMVNNLDRFNPVASAGQNKDSIVNFFNTPISTRVEVAPYLNGSQGKAPEILSSSSLSQEGPIRG
jgi:hypothetical protein